MHSMLRLPLVALLVASPALAQDMSRSSSSSSEITLSLSGPSSSSALDSPDMSRPSSLELSSESSTEVTSESSSEPPINITPSGEMLQAFYDVCTDVAGGDPEAYDRAGGAGWQAGDYEDGGPLKSIYSAYRTFEGYEEVSLWSSVETYKTQRLGYCRVDFGDPNFAIDFAGMTAIAGLSGTLIDDEGYIYGSWESPDGRIMVIGDRRDGVVEIEFNVLIVPPATQ